MPFAAYKFKLLGGTISIIEKQLLVLFDPSFCENANSVIAVDQHNFGKAIRVDGMIGKSNLVAFSFSIDHVIYKKQV